EVVLPARNEEFGGLFRSTDRGTTWELVGSRFRDVTNISAIAKGGSYVIVASDIMGYFPMDPWSSDTGGADRSGPALDVLRPAKGISRTLEMPVEDFMPPGLELSDDGLCLAYGATGGGLRMLEIEGGEPVDVGSMGDKPGPFVWLR